MMTKLNVKCAKALEHGDIHQWGVVQSNTLNDILAPREVDADLHGCQVDSRMINLRSFRLYLRKELDTV